jgi:hypothetical protein
MTTNDWHRRARATALWNAVAGLAILAVAALVAASWADDLPDPVASHWSGGGVPDGFSSLSSYITVFAVLGVVCVLGFSALCLFWGRSASARRAGVTSTIWITGFLGLTLVGSLWNQRGLADAHQARDTGGVAAIAIFIPLALAVAAGALVRPDPALPASGDVPPDAPRADVAPGERAVWVGRATGGPLPFVIVTTAALLVAVAVVQRVWALVAVAAVVTLVLTTMAAFHVRVTADGLAVRSVLGWPRTSIPADEVERADAVQVRALREFGGYGWRLGRRGRTGVVVRSGEALEVTRTGGRRFVVTVDDAADAAALLNTLAGRARAAR